MIPQPSWCPIVDVNWDECLNVSVVCLEVLQMTPIHCLIGRVHCGLDLWDVRCLGVERVDTRQSKWVGARCTTYGCEPVITGHSDLYWSLRLYVIPQSIWFSTVCLVIIKEQA